CLELLWSLELGIWSFFKVAFHPCTPAPAGLLSAMQSRICGWIVLALFFCSGATALVYEVVWSKFLSQMFGSTIYAQTAVLAAFMGGLALGNKLFGRWADRSLRPVRAYGLLEVAIGIYAFLFPLLDNA